MDEDIKILASKYSKLKSPSDAEETGLHTYTIGVLHSYARLKELNYDESKWSRDWEERYAEVKSITIDMCDGKLKDSGQWLAEYYFNNLVQRLDVAFERVAKRVLHAGGSHTKDVIPKLRTIEGYKNDWAEAWEYLRDKEANLIKHDNPGQFDSPERSNLKKLEHIIHCLIDVIDWAQSQPKKSSEYE